MSDRKRRYVILAITVLAVGVCALLVTASHWDGMVGKHAGRRAYLWGTDDKFLADSSRLPSELRPLLGNIQGGKSPEQVRELIAESFGPPICDVGSGLSIPQWDFREGVLTYHPMTGPTFRPTSGGVIWLIRTRNPLGENLPGGYQMTTPPAKYGMRYWIGNLHVNRDGTYGFVKSDANLEHSASQKHFFALHRSGRYAVEYPSGLGPKTLLETLTERTTVATLLFKADDGAAVREYLIVSDPVERSLSFAAGREFEMQTGWKNYWR